MAQPLEIAGGLKRTQAGNVDPYYDNDGAGWANVAAANAGVPAALRSRKTVLVDGAGEYWWKDGTADINLVQKTTGSNNSTGGITSVNTKTGPDVSLTTDDIPEPPTPSNKWFTAVRVLTTTLGGLGSSAGIPSATDTLLQAWGKVVYLMNSLKTVATTGSYNDLTDKPAIPTTPTGVKFTTAPGIPTITNTQITETSSVVDNNGTSVNIPGQTITYALAASTKKRIDAIVVKYTAPVAYERIVGTEVDENLTANTPTIPNDRLYVRYLTVTDGTVGQTSTGGTTVVQTTGTSTTSVMSQDAATKAFQSKFKVAPRKVLGRYSNTEGDAQHLTIGAGLTMDSAGNIALGFSETSGDTLYGRVISPKNSFLRKISYSDGYLRIDIPFVTADFFVTIRGFIREFDNNDIAERRPNRMTAFSVSGHLNANQDWINTEALFLASSDDRDLPVTFASTGTNVNRIYIGTPTTQWGNLSVTVDEVIYGRPGSSLELAQSNWVVTVESVSSIPEARQVLNTDNLPFAKAATMGVVRNDTDTYTGTPAISQIVSLTQAEYDAIGTKSSSTLYVIV